MATKKQPLFPKEVDVWHDAVDQVPIIICKTQLKDGTVQEAVYRWGIGWESAGDDHALIEPELFRPYCVTIITPLFSSPFDDEEGDQDEQP